MRVKLLRKNHNILYPKILELNKFYDCNIIEDQIRVTIDNFSWSFYYTRDWEFEGDNNIEEIINQI